VFFIMSFRRHITVGVLALVDFTSPTCALLDRFDCGA